MTEEEYFAKSVRVLLKLLTAKGKRLLEQFAQSKLTIEQLSKKLSKDDFEEVKRWAGYGEFRLRNNQQAQLEFGLNVWIPKHRAHLKERIAKLKYPDPYLEQRLTKLDDMEKRYKEALAE